MAAVQCNYTDNTSAYTGSRWSDRGARQNSSNMPEESTLALVPNIYSHLHRPENMVAQGKAPTTWATLALRPAQIIVIFIIARMVAAGQGPQRPGNARHLPGPNKICIFNIARLMAAGYWPAQTGSTVGVFRAPK